MANEYRTWFATTEQEYMVSMLYFLEHVVGWYRTYTWTDTGTDKRFAFVSEGEAYDKRPPRAIVMRGVSNEVRLDALQVLPGRQLYSYGTEYVGASSELEFRSMATPGRCRTVASKDRIFMHVQTTSTTRMSGYIGFMDSFYSPADDPSPIYVRGSYQTTHDWTVDNVGWMRRSDDGAEVRAVLHWDVGLVNEGYPNPRNGEYTFRAPEVVYQDSLQYNEVRGRLKGLYIGSVGRLAHGSFVSINGQQHLCTKNTDEVEVIVTGPVSSNGQVPINRGWMSRPNLEVDYAERGMQLDTATSGTLALWRFDTGHLGYVYGSGSTLPVPSVYIDTAGNHDLIPQNGMTSVQSRLREAAYFDGTGYATTSGTTAATAALKEEWTFECVFKPGAIPTASDRQTIIDYGSTGGGDVNNTLLRVSVSPAFGVTPDEYIVERGNLDILWEKDTGTPINSLTTGDFIQEDRWNYVAVVKKYNGSNYDIDVWHCSFGDHVVPTKKATFTSLDNATSGTSSDWFVGVDESLTNYLNSSVDDTRITERVLTDDEIISSCFRSML
jgi:hypothetical protein